MIRSETEFFATVLEVTVQLSSLVAVMLGAVPPVPLLSQVDPSLQPVAQTESALAPAPSDAVTPAPAAQAAAASTVSVAAAPPLVPKKKLGVIGVQGDVGLLDILGLSVAWRPLYFVRVHGGVTFNGVSPGVRAGVSLIAFDFPITPTMTVEAGRFFPGNANAVVQKVTGNTSFNSPLLASFGYDFANAHLGAEVGSRNFKLFLRGGLSYLSTTVRNFQSEVQNVSPTIEARDPNIRVTYPSIKLGLIFYF